MGVPKFYRWISKRYPCLSEVVKEYQVPLFEVIFNAFYVQNNTFSGDTTTLNLANNLFPLTIFGLSIFYVIVRQWIELANT